ncbi:DNA primase [Ferrovum myxofaciens]|uniref:DNA primase n=1 Tax=Ferrovum myxofaciens TaxID=416213 RepID=A0A149VW14_9PROT|nr:CHC2 zinc finger domain-containing protein [Ferrovum myxofaciens]KXW57415.1 DNA primase [Ferrovum myxofaciens]
MTGEEFLERLQGVRKTDHGWTAKCPSHNDNSPSLSVTEKDGKILLHCFAGCGAHEIVTAVGLELSDLFPEKLEFSKGRTPRFPAHEVLMGLSDEIDIASLLITRWFDPSKIWDLDHYDRLLLSNARIQSGVVMIGGHRHE